MMRARRLAFALVALAAGLVSSPASSADSASIEAAKKEREVVWYTTQIAAQLAQPMAAAFEKRYGIRVRYVRANTPETILRIRNESRAGQRKADVVDGTTSVSALKAEGLILKWQPDSAANLPKEYVDPDGYWVATNLYVMTPGYNTNLVPAGSEPKTLEDLLDPKWRGKLVWNANPSTSGGPGFIGTVLTDYGEEKGRAYLQKLAQQKIVSLHTAARQVLNQVIAGEYPIALQIFNNHAVISAKDGAPAGWIPMQPATAVLSTVAVAAGAPHPNAGKLFVDFLVSDEGQRIYQSAGYLPVSPKTPPQDPGLRPEEGKFRAVFFTPEEVDRQMPKWEAIFRELFR